MTWFFWCFSYPNLLLFKAWLWLVKTTQELAVRTGGVGEEMSRWFFRQFCLWLSVIEKDWLEWFQRFFIFTPKIGEDSHFDSYFSDGLKPPTCLNSWIFVSKIIGSMDIHGMGWFPSFPSTYMKITKINHRPNVGKFTIHGSQERYIYIIINRNIRPPHQDVSSCIEVLFRRYCS